MCFGFALFWEVVCSMLIYDHIGTSYILQNKILCWVETGDMTVIDFLNNSKSVVIV
jgi:hypothetical protein